MENETKRQEAVGIALLKDILGIFHPNGPHGEYADKLSSAQLIGALSAISGSPWRTIDKDGGAITYETLAKLLLPFQIQSRNMYLDGRQVRGYEMTQFYPAWYEHLERETLPAMLAWFGLRILDWPDRQLDDNKSVPVRLMIYQESKTGSIKGWTKLEYRAHELFSAEYDPYRRSDPRLETIH